MGGNHVSGKADNSKWILEEHTERKHRVLSYYLSIWSKILGENNANLIYWDFFAGRGDYSEGEPGSPLIAMNISKERYESGNSLGRPISITCVFIEEDKNCYYYLQNLLRDLYPDLEGDRWHLFHGDCQKKYDELQISENDSIFTKRIPQFFFLDPYGPILPLEMLKRIMAKPRHEMILNFMVEWINRFTTDKIQENNLKAIFGVENLSVLRDIQVTENPIPNITEYYISRLMADDGARVKYVTRPFEMIPDRRQSTLYYILGCTNNPLGIQKMSESMRAISNNEDYSYRGKFEYQMTLEFLGRDKIKEIADWVFENYIETEANFELIYTFCCGRQTWSRSEVRDAILQLERNGKLVVQPKSGRKRVGNTFSDHTIVFQRE
ncbi:MAG: three-Cys-motif partner protein TcmP [Candidatus Thorarchaeota archaeon]|nr:MAG: three-Cys-motif partner protein TcmP [Candidatus Thorarchaeota archaeon]